VCALLFKWDKEQVDRQPTQYLMNTILINIELISNMFDNLGVKQTWLSDKPLKS
tara:strand:- start:831 stop:992 length:162 start_codon:yes stop_codon:yes gene_type:complete